MTALVNTSLHEVLRQYPYSIEEIQLISSKVNRSVWWIKTDHGPKILKKLCCCENTIKFIIDSILYLQSKNINIPKIYKNHNNQFYCNIDNNFYILMEFIEGVKLNLTNSTHLKSITVELAKFHKASIGFKPSSKKNVVSHLGKWPHIIEHRIKILQNLYNQETNNNSHTEFEDLILKELPHFINNLEHLQSQLSSSEYYSWVDKLKTIGGLCHSDFSSKNLITDLSGKLYILDFDTVNIDTPPWDIRMLIHRAMDKIKPFTQNHLNEILNWYQQENPLTSKEWNVVKLFLSYPHKISFMLKYNSTNINNWSEVEYIRRFKEAIIFDNATKDLIAAIEKNHKKGDKKNVFGF